MLFFDTETTGLVKEGLRDLTQQPHIVELALVQTNSKGKPLAQFQSLINPGVPIPQEATKVHGITDQDVKTAPTFAAVLPKLIELFRDDDTLIAHNVRFDLMMLVHELMRVDWLYRFPFPSTHIDTVPMARAACGSGSLQNWSKHVLGDKFTPQNHRAMGDVERLIACWKTLK